MNNKYKIIDFPCEVCGASTVFNGEVIHGIHINYRHRCQKCGHLQAALDIYPKMIPVDNNLEPL